MLVVILTSVVTESNLLDGKMICHFTAFSAVFQSHQDSGRMILKGCVQWNLLCS